MNFISRRVKKGLDTHLPLSSYYGQGHSRFHAGSNHNVANGPLRARGRRLPPLNDFDQNFFETIDREIEIFAGDHEWRRQSNNRVMRGS